jgi:hypothetical protein
MMDLNDAQKQAVGDWVDAGCGLSEIQKKLSEEFGVSMTYMDVRFLILDLGLTVRDKADTSPPSPDPAFEEATQTPDEVAGAPAADADVGGVTLEVDRIMKPGSIVSGSVTFSDGVTASWSLDQLGRLAIDAGKAGYRPNQDDLQAFQLRLREALEKRGF